MTTATISRQATTSRSRRRPRIRVLPIVVIGLLLLVEIYPLFWLLSSSLKTNFDFLNNPSWSLPTSLNWSNYVDAFRIGQVGRYALNSAIAVFPSLAMIIVLGTAAGFALEVMVFKGRALILLLFLGGIMIPGQMILLPLFSAYYNLGLTGTLWPLIITYTGTGLPLTVFMMATYFRAVPRELFEASTLDGASILKSFRLIAFPLARNSILTVGLVQFFFLWNDLLISITFTNDSALSTIQVGLLNFSGQRGDTNFGPLFAAISINVIGTLIVYLFLNRQVIRGLAAGSLKG